MRKKYSHIKPPLLEIADTQNMPCSLEWRKSAIEDCNHNDNFVA